MTEHHNACLRLAKTPWVFLLHDDDELYPYSLDKVQLFLSRRPHVGIVVAGIQRIDKDGKSLGIWIPKIAGTFSGDDGLLRLGLDFTACPPGWIWSVDACREVGGFLDVTGLSADYTLALRLAYSYGVAFLPELVGRYRVGHVQTTDYSTPEKAEALLDRAVQFAALLRDNPCPIDLADKVVDYMTWFMFSFIAPRWLESNPAFVIRLFRKCMRLSPQNGPWKNHARREYPFLFWRPYWLGWPLYRIVRAVLPAGFLRRLRAHHNNLITSLRLGTLRRLTPFNRVIRHDRWEHIDRYYIDAFLSRYGADLHGQVLEIGEPIYSRKCASDRLTKLESLRIVDTSFSVTISTDDSDTNESSKGPFDCIILVHTLQCMLDVRPALKQLYGILKPGGTLLATFPGIAQTSRYDIGTLGDYWRFTSLAARRLFEDVFPNTNLSVATYGNVLSAITLLHGLPAKDLRREELDYSDPDYEVVVAVRAVKP
jgi:SAM-dependent methyltransferase